MSGSAVLQNVRSPWLAVLVVIALVVRLLVQKIAFDRKYRFPAKIPGVPFFGNAFQMPPVAQGPYLKKIAAEKGEM